MKTINEFSQEELNVELDKLKAQYDEFKAKDLKLNMARGNPSKQQLDLSREIFDIFDKTSDFIDAQGNDVREYGNLNGVYDARELMASVVDVPVENCIVCGSSSLNIMYDCFSRAFMFGICGSEPWSKLDKVKFICPVPGYDRHFAICEEFGIEMIALPLIGEADELTERQLDIAKIEALVAQDASIKGVWCVPQYSNPSGITYSDEVVERLAALKPAAGDFRIFWDNAYCVHHLYEDNQDAVANILDACERAGNPDLVYEFCSTSKVTNPGSGIAAFISSKRNIEDVQSRMKKQIIGYDKINHLRHAKFLKDKAGTLEHMKKHAEIIRPKFECVLQTMDDELAEYKCEIKWAHPKGGYFIYFEGAKGSAKRVVELAKNAGMVLTGAGSVWPYGKDPYDNALRICPTYPPIEELELAAKLFCICAKIATIETLL